MLAIHSPVDTDKLGLVGGRFLRSTIHRKARGIKSTAFACGLASSFREGFISWAELGRRAQTQRCGTLDRTLDVVYRALYFKGNRRSSRPHDTNWDQNE